MIKKLLIAILLIFVFIAFQSGTPKEDGKKSPYAYSIYDIENASFYDDKETFKYYWAANFKSDYPENTKLNCRIDAFNAKNEVIATLRQVYNVVNEGQMVPYMWGGMPETTKKIYNAIDYFDISCQIKK